MVVEKEGELTDDSLAAGDFPPMECDKRARKGCPGIVISIDQSDPDADPDDPLLDERYNVMDLAGLDPAKKFTVCGCYAKSQHLDFVEAEYTNEPGSGIFQPELLRAMRILCMNETELYFAGGQLIEW